MGTIFRGISVLVLCIASTVTAATAITPSTALVATSPSGSQATNIAVVTRKNIPPHPDYFTVCAHRGRNDPTCIATELAAIDNARSHEHHMKKQRMILPDNYRKLSVAEQTFVVMNLERVDRGVRPITGLVPKLNAVSHLAAALQIDPTITGLLARLLGIREWRSIWASDLGPLASDYDWMYNDGYSPTGSINEDCPTPTSSGCWGHRRNILGTFHGLAKVVAGAGTSKPVGASIAEISVGIVHPAPKYSYTWKQALNHGANGHRIAAAH